MNVNIKKQSKEYKKRHKMGQFFTSDKLVDFITNTFKINFNHKSVLEPSFGGCSFVKYIVEHSNNVKLTAIDIDNQLCEKYSKIYKNTNFICQDFLGYQNKELFDIVIGNPPFNLKTKYHYYDTTEGFLKRSLEMLKPNGYLYFVIPSTVLRNKQYQSTREYIINNYEILGIINTSNYEFLGADIETVVIGIKNKSVKKQEYFYINNNTSKKIYLTVNERESILLNNLDMYNKFKKKFACYTIKDIFNVFRGPNKLSNGLQGRQINYFSPYLEESNNGKYFIGLQNIAYRFASNLIQGDIGTINDTVTILESKVDIDYKKLCFISEYLNSSIANYLLHVNALNGCKLTIHIDKYYISDIFLPDYNNSFCQYLHYVNNISNTEEVGQYRNNYFYNLLKLSQDDIKEIESLWRYPKFKKKIKYILKENN